MIKTIIRAAHQHGVLRAAMMPARKLVAHYMQKRDRVERAAIERIASMLVEDPVLRVNEFVGVFALSPQSHIFRRVAMAGHYEPELTARCRVLLDVDRDVMDIGANVGFHKVLLGGLLRKGRLLAVEPTHDALKRLRRNIIMNGVGDKVAVLEGVASDAPGQIEIKIVAGLEEYSTIGALEHPSVANAEIVTRTVEARTLDQLATEHGLDVGFIKVDVEGAEHLVFRGGQATLARCRPVVLSELSDTLLRKNGSSSQEVIKMFEVLGYVVSDPMRPNLKPGNVEFGDILCIPREHPLASAA